MILTCSLVVLLSFQCGAAPSVGDTIRMLAHSPISVYVGHSATLPCWLSPPQSAETLDIHWYHSDHPNAPILIYQHNETIHAAENKFFQGRVSFGTKDAESAGLRSGDVSLRLLNVTLRDAGEYTCQVSDDKDYDLGSVTLTVLKTGGHVHLSPMWRENNTVNVSCESQGWYPEPRLQWRDSRGNLLSPEIPLKSSRDSSGLVSVHSWLLVSSSSEVSCSVALDGGEIKEASMNLDGLILPAGQWKDSIVVGLAVTLLVIAVLVALGVLWIIRRGSAHCCKRQEAMEDGSSQGQRMPGPQEHNPLVKWKQAKKFTEKTMTFVTLNNGYIRVVEKGKTAKTLLQGRGLEEVTSLTALTGKPGFSSGRHYWEVSMENVGGVKRSWWLGVTLDKVLVPCDKLDVGVSDGFWFLSSSSEGFHFNSQPQKLLPVTATPKTVGVYLDCDNGELSFYNVEEQSLIGSMKVDTGKRLFPLFNTGLCDHLLMRLN